jgi:hypothetical protein
MGADVVAQLHVQLCEYVRFIGINHVISCCACSQLMSELFQMILPGLRHLNGSFLVR